MSTQTHWRLAMMFDAPGGDIAAMEKGMVGASEVTREAAASHPVRLGVTDTLPEGFATEILSNWRSVDGALEVTIPNDRAGDAPAICRALKPLLEQFTDLATLEVMAGPIFYMLPVRHGTAFISLNFRRLPGRTSQQFRDWWRVPHAAMAIPVLSPQLLAYDQVHVDQAASRAAAEALGVPYVEYDAYDNLTWADRAAFVESCTQDLEGMARVREDEMTNIDDTSRRYALMRELV